jgi:hypothetical protein
MGTQHFNPNNPEGYKSLKLKLQQLYPWIELVTLKEFASITYDIIVIHNGIFDINDLIKELNNIVSDKLVDKGYLMRVSSDDEALGFDLTSKGINQGFKCVKAEKVDLYDLFLLWSLRNRLKTLEQDEANVTLTNEMEIILKRNGVAL